jgi:hypothetical protein
VSEFYVMCNMHMHIHMHVNLLPGTFTGTEVITGNARGSTKTEHDTVATKVVASASLKARIRRIANAL